MTTFRDDHPELQQLVLEHLLLRRWNKEQEAKKEYGRLLLFAEGAVILLVFERFLRIILSDRANDNDTLFTLLEKATSNATPLLKFDGDRDEGIRKVTKVRNTILHANYEQAAKETGLASGADYLRKQFAPEIEYLAGIVDEMLQQIDVTTGKPWPRQDRQ
jgi:hypothetical protein